MKSSLPEEALRNGCEVLKLSVSDLQIERLLEFCALLGKWNRVYNLTAIDDPVAVVRLHLLDSLAVQNAICGIEVLDVGTGAGFPGLPLAVINPERRFCLLDPSGKKIRFLRQVVIELGLNNVSLVQARIETFSPMHRFDTVLSRAFAKFSMLLGVCVGLLSDDGVLIVCKGRNPDAEVAGLDVPTEIIPVNVPGLDAHRHLVCYRRQTAHG